jgi:hypothetical protein
MARGARIRDGSTAPFVVILEAVLVAAVLLETGAGTELLAADAIVNEGDKFFTDDDDRFSTGIDRFFFSDDGDDER